MLYSSRNVSLNGINVEKIRSKEEFSKEIVFGIGETSFFHFPDSFDDHPENQSGFSHAARPKLINLLPDNDQAGLIPELMSKIKAQLNTVSPINSLISAVIPKNAKQIISLLS